ncbi:MAG TPA: hypothetical protein VNT57_03005 [Desulfobacteria bacterium]|nr:hypothetical protein [Desulfobacteria bacterium]
MKTLIVLAGIVTNLLLLSTAICGLWIRANKITDISSVNFHVTIGSLSVVFGVLSATILIKLLLKNNMES